MVNGNEDNSYKLVDEFFGHPYKWAWTIKEVFKK